MDSRLDLLLQLGGIGTDELIDLFAVLENDESGHGADAVFLSELSQLVDVDFEEMCIGIPLGEFHDLGRNSLLVSTIQNRPAQTLIRSARPEDRMQKESEQQE